MAKRITADDRRFVKKVETRRAKGWTWHEIALDLSMPLKTCYAKYERLHFRITLDELQAA